ncbi:histidine ammonia-lyase [Nocardioides marmoribigeumensis]|uniref:Histidine ammonia-lyase n=1 Tax=Nocardioides marmoribigeumensis TaxID=433649 RepID=A0ABU2BVF5_9ACTN|nr:histidine ammonia-lyase [Nocardioides marmoribigeumensis]MDR7362610.1 histidine ammonia-lyase [Nocardioides marmoribigeumensis]
MTTTHATAPGTGLAPVVVGTGPVSFADVVSVARGGAGVRLAPEAVAALEAARAVVDALAQAPTPAYGISTGFGALATRHIPAELRAQLQRSLVRSHAAGSGPEVEREVVRGLMLLRLSTLATGHTGVRPATAQLLADLLTHGITPVVHEYGSLGCSGDLAPLSHVALALIGEGTVHRADGTLTDAATALAECGLAPVELGPKEGLALINGTDGMTGMLVLALHDLDNLLRVADVAAAMSVEGQLATDRVFAEDLQALRPHPGQAASAANLRRLLADSGVVASHRGPDCNRVQDAYSLRCSPQVHGAVRDTRDHAALVAGRELASAIDNPVVVFDRPAGVSGESGGGAPGRVESNGNFHGAPVGYVLDFLAIAVADLASISERRTDRFLDRARSHGLPPFLAGDPGVDSGHMIAQYTSAGIVSELKRLATPASVDSIPSSAMQEDHVSMGWAAARKLRRSVDGLSRVLAIEVLTAARALDLRAPLAPSPATAAVLALLRQSVPGPGPDRYLAPEIESAVQLVQTGALLSAVQEVIGELA